MSSVKACSFAVSISIVKAVVLKFKLISESPGGFIKTDCWASSPDFLTRDLRGALECEYLM